MTPIASTRIEAAPRSPAGQVWRGKKAHFCDCRHIRGGRGLARSESPKPMTWRRAMRQDETFQSRPASVPAADASPRGEIDWEERRWQLEWARRNIED